MSRLADKVALITGGASGLGKAMAQRFGEEGAKVVVADVDEEKGQEVVSSLENGLFVEVDVTKAESVEAMVDKTVEHFGRLDILVNNAGIDGEQAPTAKSSLDNWRKVININLDGVFYGMKYGIAAMLESGDEDSGGVVINLGSTAGLVGFPGISPYSASKGGVIQLTKAAAMEYADKHVRCCALCPTGILTPLVEHFIENSDNPEEQRKQFTKMNPIPGAPEPIDVANAALFLASDEARFITGVALPVDGGYTAR